MSDNLMTIGDTRLEFCWVGVPESSEPVIVFLHEGLGCVALWREFPHRLCQKLGMRGFIYSRAGYGKSDPCDLPRPVIYMHDEGKDILPRVLDEAGIQQAILIGHSDGGSIALIHAGSNSSSRISAIITLAAHVFSESRCVGSFTAARENYQSGDLRDKLKKYHGVNVDTAFYGWYDAWAHPDFEYWNIEEFLPDIDIPALVIQGADDAYGTKLQVDAIVAGIGSSTENHIIPDCGHSPHLEKPEATMSLICDFINRL
ncbi:MAG: alpha/beta hydrolase [Hyphomicrobiales bacterium]|nr:alpha/beta hydrolase [Hyphomicrobiales bacterium]